MSKIGNHIVGLQETEDYKFGWQSAERGEPEPNWLDDREGLSLIHISEPTRRHHVSRMPSSA